MTCAFRRQDIPQSVMASIEKYQSSKSIQYNFQNKNINNSFLIKENSDKNTAGSTPTSNGVSGETTQTKTENINNCDYEESEVSDLNDQQRYNLKHRELYYSKYTDTIAATTIRAKCSVLLFNEEVERYSDFLTREVFFNNLIK